MQLFFIALLCSIPVSQPFAQTSARATVVSEALARTFGSTVTPVSTFSPFYLTGDFNGDGAEDVLIVVRITRPRKTLPVAVKLLNPFYHTAPSAYPADPVAKPTLALAIIHGAKGGWHSAPAGAQYLLVGESPILVLENSRAESNQPGDRNRLLELIRKRSGRRGAARPPAGAKGDAILLGTEATESFLYWNGTTYVWKEASDEGD
jgi:hypothetical protein